MDLYSRVRHAVLIEGMSRREAARVFGIDRRTVDKMLRFSVPPGYRRSEPPRRPKLDPFTGIIDAILEADKTVPKKQKHTSKRVFERLRDEHSYDGGQALPIPFPVPRHSQPQHIIQHRKHILSIRSAAIIFKPSSMESRYCQSLSGGVKLSSILHQHHLLEVLFAVLLDISKMRDAKIIKNNIQALI